MTCNKKVRATRSLPCHKHILQVQNGEVFICSSVSCSFFLESTPHKASTEENEGFYHQCSAISAAKITNYVCVECRDPFLEMAKMQKKYEKTKQSLHTLLEKMETQESSNKTGPNKNDICTMELPKRKLLFADKESNTKTELKAHQFQLKEVFEEIIEQTNNEVEVFVGMVKNSSLMISKNDLLSGKVKNNKKLIVNFHKDSVIAKYDVIDNTVKTQYLLKPHHKMTMQSLTKEILVSFKELQDSHICCGIFEQHWVTACKHYNLNNVFKGNKTKYHIDNSHTLRDPSQATEVICETVRSTLQNGSNCHVILPKSGGDGSARQFRCEPCSQLLRKCIRKLPRVFVKPNLNDGRTDPNSKTPMTSLQPEELLQRCRRMGEYIHKLKKSQSLLLKQYEHESKRENLIKMPENVFLTSGKLGSLIDLAFSQNLLQENSVLYALLCDTLTSLIKAEAECKDPTKLGKKMQPKGMRFHPVVLKWCAELARKCGQGGYNLVREILPIPSLITVNSYRQSQKSYRVVSPDNLKLFSQELTMRKCKAIGGIH